MEDRQAVVVDCGSWNVTAGFVGDNAPTCFSRSAVLKKNGVCGDEAAASYSSDCVMPIDRGLVTDWEAYEQTWHHEVHPFLVIIHCLKEEKRRRKEELAKLLVETFNVPALTFTDAPLLHIVECGCRSGLVVLSDDSITTITPITEYVVDDKNTIEIRWGGDDVTLSLLRSLQKSKTYAANQAATELELVGEIKEKCGNARDYPDYELPEGTMTSSLFLLWSHYKKHI